MKAKMRISTSFLAGASLLILAACQTTQSSSSSDVSETTEVAALTDSDSDSNGDEAEAVRAIDNVMFLDSSAFDDSLSSSLADKTEAVKIAVPAKFSLNEVPERMNIWLQRVQESGGSVNAQPISEDANRSIIGALITITIELVSYARQEAMYKPADIYDATMMYDEDTGEVKEVVFVKR